VIRSLAVVTVAIVDLLVREQERRYKFKLA
jgi:hypothetical protein